MLYNDHQDYLNVVMRELAGEDCLNGCFENREATRKEIQRIVESVPVLAIADLSAIVIANRQFPSLRWKMAQ